MTFRNTPSHKAAVMSAVVANFVTLGAAMSHGILQQLHHINPALDASYFQVAWISGLQLTCLQLGATLPELWCRAPPRPVMATGAVLCLAGRLWASFSSSYGQVVASEGLLLGVGSALVHHPSLTLVRCHYPGPSARLPLHLSRCGAMVGAIFWSLLAQFLTRHAGIVWAQRGLASVSILFLVCCCALAPAGLAHAHSHDDGDEDELPTTKRSHAHSQGVATALIDQALLVALFLIYAGASMACTFVMPLALRAGVAPTTAGFAQVGMYSVGLAGYFMMGDIERAVPRKWILVAAAAVSGCQLALFPLMLSTPVVLLFFCQLGLFLAMLMATTPPYFLQSISFRRGARLQILASSMGFLLGGPFCGFVEDSAKGWVGGSVACMAALLGGSLTLATALTCKSRL